MKARLSTKMVGETLEQHCEIEFNRIRATAFPHAYFEKDNDLYNAGIVDVFHRHPKMYVVRPQFFIPIITLLRNAATKALAYKNELAIIKAQNIDITRFETQLDDFKTAFGRNWRLASEGFEEAIKRIDEAIKDLEKNQRCAIQIGQQPAPGE